MKCLFAFILILGISTSSYGAEENASLSLIKSRLIEYSPFSKRLKEEFSTVDRKYYTAIPDKSKVLEIIKEVQKLTERRDAEKLYGMMSDSIKSNLINEFTTVVPTNEIDRLFPKHSDKFTEQLYEISKGGLPGTGLDPSSFRDVLNYWLIHNVVDAEAMIKAYMLGRMPQNKILEFNPKTDDIKVIDYSGRIVAIITRNGDELTRMRLIQSGDIFLLDN